MVTFISKILKLKNFHRKLILFFFDTLLCIGSFFIAYFLRLDLIFINETDNQILSFFILYIIFILLSLSFHFYRPLSRYYDLFNFAKIILVFSLYAVITVSIFQYLKIHGVPRSIGLLHPMVFLLLFISSRTYIFFFLRKFSRNYVLKNAIVFCEIKNIEFIKSSLKSYNILLFVFADKNYETRMVGNVPIVSISNLDNIFLKNKKINFLFIDQSINSEKIRKKIISKIKNKEKIKIKIIPKVENFLDFKLKEDIKKINIFNKKIVFSEKKLNLQLKNSTILVTGAGGSIGSELVKEILRLNPKRILLIENSEYNLYKLLEDLAFLKAETKYKCLIDYFLISVTDFKKLENLSIKFKPDYIFHCAAYKHVPLVENNIIEAIENNFKSTLNLCRISLKYKVSKLILISSDKAVRPSSIMGSTKRLSELAIKYYSLIGKKKKSKTIFSAVRFANVLNSSGSVVPLFAKQIQAGGPITITDKTVERYFMTITNAVKLVLETTLISKSGDIMLLKMGKQIKILDIAYRLANFYGRTIKDKNNLTGEIDIVEIGLRPGEKIREELYYYRKTLKTKNKDILCVDSIKFNLKKFENLKLEVDKYITQNNPSKLRALLLNQENMF